MRGAEGVLDLQSLQRLLDSGTESLTTGEGRFQEFMLGKLGDLSVKWVGIGYR